MNGSVSEGRDRLLAALRRARFTVPAAVLLALAVPQVYALPKGLIDVALTTVVAVLLAPALLLALRVGPDRALFRTPLVGVLLVLLALRLLAVAWSPDPRAGLPYLTLLGQFLVTLTLIWLVLRRDPDALRRLQRFYWPWVLAEAALVVLFRFLPGVEDAFLRSVAGFFVGHNNIASLFGDNPNNVFDPAKSGGVFVNANVAAMFLGVNGLAALALAAVTGDRRVRLVGLVTLATVPFTGSKAATVLVVALPAAAYGLYRLRRSAPAARRYVLSAGAVAAVAGVLVLALNQRFLGALAHTLFVRAEIWQFGAEAVQEQPLLGLGYGGWDAGFARYADEHDIWRIFPPHNLLLATWSVTGIPGVLLTVAFFGLLFRVLLRRWRGSAGSAEERFTLYAGAALTWILVQGMGENTDLFGEIHLIPVVALLVARLIRPVAEESENHAESAHRAPEEPADREAGEPAGGRSAGGSADREAGEPGPADRGDRPAHSVPAVGDLHREPGPGAAELPAGVRDPGPGAR